jgi:predicted unusual protein kinase regulating ubiquinone biosynthesis (AarF/ABC1/UbiB family)
LAAVLTNKILQLGPTFIKLGQLLSTRVDILPREYIDKLIQLQDNVPGFSGDAAVKLVEAQLGKPIDQLFDSFNSTPIAAASLGQVHIAYKNGQKLAVKVQRQGLKELFDMDLKNIKVLVKLLDKFDPKSDGAARDWSSIYDESSKLLYREIDYKAEALNSIRFKENFADVPWVKVPDVSDDGVNLFKQQLQYCIISCIIRTGCFVLFCIVFVFASCSYLYCNHVSKS